MDKCRICLGNRKNLVSIYELDTGTSYADMITSVAKVKIQRDETITNKLCRMCRRKLREMYEFKILIEKSDATLYENTNLKKLNFNNINDIKIEVEIEKYGCNQSTKCEDMTEYFKDGVNEVCYSDTVIKKLDTSNDADSAQPIPVLEFLKTIKEEPDDDGYNDLQDYVSDRYGPDSDFDDDYIPPYNLLHRDKNEKYKKKKIIKKVTKITKMATKVNGQRDKVKAKPVCIKPVYLGDLKLVKTKVVVASKESTKKKQAYHARLQMCPHCGKMTRSLKNHMLQHTGERKFKCDQCEKGFFTEKDLSRHIRLHTSTKDFKCDQCVAAFSQKSALKNHMLRHSAELKHACEICSKRFKRRMTLQRHVRMHNSANKNVMCDLCNMSFFDKGQLRHHMRVHTGERPYNCQICSQPYSYKHDFNRHCFKKHGIFLKRRSVYIMNEEVLEQEKALMRELIYRVRGIIQDGKPLNPFDGPQAAMAFEQAVKALESKQIPIDI